MAASSVTSSSDGLSGAAASIGTDEIIDTGTDDTVAAISRSVGYTSPFTFSDAFKRSYGTSPVEHRRRGRAG